MLHLSRQGLRIQNTCQNQSLNNRKDLQAGKHEVPSFMYGIHSGAGTYSGILSIYGNEPSNNYDTIIRPSFQMLYTGQKTNVVGKKRGRW